jgi:hypothetical protein
MIKRLMIGGGLLVLFGVVIAILYIFTECILPFDPCPSSLSWEEMLDFAEETLKDLGELSATSDFQVVRQKIGECRSVGARKPNDELAMTCATEALSLLSEALINQAKAKGLKSGPASQAQAKALEAQKAKKYAEAFTFYRLVQHLIQEELIKSHAHCICDFETHIDAYPHIRGILDPSPGISYSIEKDTDKQNKVLKLDYAAKRDFDFIPIGLKKLNLAEYKYLVFDVKGDKSVSFFKVELKRAGATTGIPTVYVRDRLDGTWQWVIIPLEDFAPKIPDEPDELVFVFEAWKGARKGTVYVDNLCFSKERLGLKDLALAGEMPKITLDEIQKRAILYFWEQANPENGLIKDRSTADSPSSIATVGFGLTALIIGVERGWLSKDEVYSRILTTLRFFKDTAQEEHGFFYHFLDMKAGKRYRWPDGKPSELSSIDTALFLAGALFAGEYFKGTEVAKLAQEIYERVNWGWMLNGGETLSMCWTPEEGFCEARWADYAEHMVMYLLAIGSPTYPIPPESWDAWERPIVTRYGLQYIHNPIESLFVYQYSHAYVDFKNKHDKYADYWQNSINAITANREFALQNMDKYSTYGPNIWGITAGDGPEGYKNYGASPGNHDGTIAPYGMIASMPFVPELAQKGIETMAEQYGGKIWGKYGFTSGFNKDKNWYSDRYVGIDQGIIALMLENYRTGFVWKIFMQNEALRRAMQKVGFVEEKIEGALTPWYREQLEGQR